MNNTLVLTIETTGLSVTDELLEVSIISSKTGEEAYKKRFKPNKITSWPEAMYINNITPDMVSSERHFSMKEAKAISKLLSTCDILVVFNAKMIVEWFNKYEIAIPKSCTVVDIMYSASPIMKNETVPMTFNGMQFNAYPAVKMGDCFYKFAPLFRGEDLSKTRKIGRIYEYINAKYPDYITSTNLVLV